ncbi:metaxin-2-like isoform X3 [Nymphalis io]|uniref:metaxin-2-like isoform X2 n=1 Tax=Inachis io TaxID=171585 RepID=UPI0021681370|nr:metaxin-2-like isoform X2 [Nymphalis io]XP_050358871.1 metaxin-2-like isoform X3 [Nymphalis io]
MPEVSLKDTIITSLNAQEPWPDNVKLFQPYEVEQILLPDNASCLAVQAFLKMCNLPFEVEMRWNAEFMSPSGRVPFIKCGAFVVSELEPIVQFAANKGVTLCSKLSTEERAEMRAYMSLITNVLVNAELYISWVDQETFNTVTRVRNSSVYPWPLGWLQTRSKRSSVIKRLKALHWNEKTLDQVLADVEQCCNSLSQRLGDRDYFFGTPSPLDALIYGHMKALLSATGPKAALMIKPITNALLKHFLRMSNITQMKLTPQEEYLVAQGCQLCVKRRVSPVRSLSRVKRSKMCIRKSSRDNLVCNKDVFGFKPFASKQIIIMTSNEGKITCEYNSNSNKKIALTDVNKFIIDIVDELIDKVDKISDNKLKYIHRDDFEVIAYPNENFNFERKVNDLDTIDETGTDVTVSDLEEEEIKVIDSVVDSDVIVDTETLFDSDVVINSDIRESSENFMDSRSDYDSKSAE